MDHADTPDKGLTPGSRGVEAPLDGIRMLHHPDDQAQRKASAPVSDALYAHCEGRAPK